MPIRAIAYSSQAMPGLSIDDVENLATSADNFNKSADVTGILLFDGSRFMQYIEGPDEGLKQVYSRIIASRQHSEIIELARGQISGRRFPPWPLRLLSTQHDQLRSVARGDWTGFALSRGGRAPTGTGMDRLQQAVAESMHA